MDDLTLPAVSSQPPDPQVDCKLPHLAGTSKNSYMCKNLKLLLAKSYKLWGSFMVFTFRVKNVKTSLGARNLVSRRRFYQKNNIRFKLGVELRRV